MYSIEKESLMANANVLTTKLDFWVKKNKNVLFIGKHGVGKTAMVKDTFDRHGLNWRYFSASTMDPWVDFIGVPREKTENKIPEQFEIIKELASINPSLAHEWVQSNWKLSPESARNVVNHTLNRQEGLTYLDLVRPQTFAAGEVEALFFDEYNRSPKKVRNAVMELIQFKSINGLKFPKLRFVWAAINPDDDEGGTYDVERLDPAQADRYHVSVEVPYRPNTDWFRTKYGQRIADAAVQWWDELSDEDKDRISPRRLQYALDVYEERGDMRDILPFTVNVSKLSTALNTGPTTEKLEVLMKSKDVAEARNFLQNENNYASAMKYIPKSETLTAYFFPLLSKEKLSALMNEDDKSCNYIIANTDKIPVFKAVCKEIINANTNARLAKKIRRTLTENEELAKAFAADEVSTADKPHFNKGKEKSWSTTLSSLKNVVRNAPNLKTRISAYEEINSNISEKQTADQALETLEVLNELFKDNLLNVKSETFQNLVGIINNCIAAIHNNTGWGWAAILNNHGARFKSLLERIKLEGLSSRLYTP